MKKYNFYKLTKTQLNNIRKDIILNSLFIKDYQNRYGIDPGIVCDFFNSLLDNAEQEIKEKYPNAKSENIFYLAIELCNNTNYMYNYYCDCAASY